MCISKHYFSLQCSSIRLLSLALIHLTNVSLALVTMHFNQQQKEWHPTYKMDGVTPVNVWTVRRRESNSGQPSQIGLFVTKTVDVFTLWLTGTNTCVNIYIFTFWFIHLLSISVSCSHPNIRICCWISKIIVFVNVGLNQRQNSSTLNKQHWIKYWLQTQKGTADSCIHAGLFSSVFMCF